jgi:hypothetical protein
VDQAIHTPGALLFSFNSDPNGHNPPVHQHVAISLGDGKTIEALGSQYGVGSFDATPKRFQYAAVIPGISDHATGAGPAVVTTDAHGGVVVAPLVDPTHPTATPTVTPVTDPHAPVPQALDPHGGDPPPGNDFSDRLALDPDQLDSGPGAPPGGPPPPHEPPPATPHEPPHEPLHLSLVDANDDGLDDSLAGAGNVPGTHADDGWDHDHGHGH